MKDIFIETEKRAFVSKLAVSPKTINTYITLLLNFVLLFMWKRRTVRVGVRWESTASSVLLCFPECLHGQFAYPFYNQEKIVSVNGQGARWRDFPGLSIVTTSDWAPTCMRTPKRSICLSSFNPHSRPVREMLLSLFPFADVQTQAWNQRWLAQWC